MRRVTRLVLAGILVVLGLAAGAGKLLGSGILHPMRKPLLPSHVEFADAAFAGVNAHREDFEVRAPDGILLRGWKVRAAKPNGDWVLLFHGVSDNRIGVIGHAEFLLRSGYSVVMMDARAHGASDGAMATYGWLERNDTRAIVEALESSEKVGHLYALGESMGASIALQSAAVEPRIEAVVAESAFSNLREVSYDYAGLRLSAWLGKTLFRPASMVAIHYAQEEGGFHFDDVSPERAVAARPFPVFLICDARDRNIPCRHSERIHKSATGWKQFWRVPRAGHTAALGTAPAEFTSRVLNFFESVAVGKPLVRFHDQQDAVILVLSPLGMSFNVLEHASHNFSGTLSAPLLDCFGQPRPAVFISRGIHRFGDSVGARYENIARAELHFPARITHLGQQAHHQPALGEEFVAAIGPHHGRRNVSRVDVAHPAPSGFHEREKHAQVL